MGNKKIDVLELYQDPRLIKALNEWDILSFLDDNNISYLMDGKNIGVGFIGVSPCIFCGDTRNHFGIHKERKYGSCFICKGYAGPLKLISHYGHMGIEDAFKFLIYGTEDNRDVDERVLEIIKGDSKYIKENSILTDIDKIPEEFRPISKLDLKRNIPLQKFFRKRFLRTLDISRYDLHINRKEILWPIKLKNRVVSYQKRNYLFKRYYTPTNLQNYIYGMDEILPNKPLILVEGFFDYTRINNFIKANFPNDISVTTGMLKSISGIQKERIINCNPSKIIVMFDNDSWFDYYRVKKLIPFNVDYIILPKGKDPNMLTWKEMETIFKEEIKL
jgi:hypothetical protein